MKKLIATFIVSTCAMVYANTQLGSCSLSSTSGVADLIAVGRNAASESKNSSHSIFIGNNSGYAVNNLNNVIAIGDGAVVGASNLSGVVAIGDNELANVRGLSDTISINKQQLFVSGVANAFSINPRQESSITNTPLYYFGGEMHLKADAIRLSSKASTIIGKEIVADADVESFNIPLQVVVTNKDYSSGNTYIYRVTNCTAYARYYPSENDYTFASFVVSVYPQVFEFYTTGAGAYYEEHYRYLYEDYIAMSFHELPIKPTGTIASLENPSATITILDNYTALCTVPITDRISNFTYNISVKIPLDKLFKDKPIDPILHNAVRQGEKNSIVSSAGIYNFVDARLGGLTFALENGSLVLYSGGKKVGRLILSAD